MSEEKEQELENVEEEVTPPEEPQGPKDWDGNLIEEGDTVFFNLLDKGTVLGEEDDGRIRIESEEKNATPGHPWKIIWLIPPGLLTKEKPKDEIKPTRVTSPTDRGACNR